MKATASSYDSSTGRATTSSSISSSSSSSRSSSTKRPPHGPFRSERVGRRFRCDREDSLSPHCVTRKLLATVVSQCWIGCLVLLVLGNVEWANAYCIRSPPPARQPTNFCSGHVSRHRSSRSSRISSLFSSFYDKFEETEDDDDEDDDDDDDLSSTATADDTEALAKFRSRMANLFEDSGASGESSSSGNTELLGGYSSSSGSESAASTEDWAIVSSTVKPGCLLVANPAAFLSDYGATSSESSSSSSATAKSTPISFFNPFAKEESQGTGNKIRPALLTKFGLQMSPPADLGPDRRADLLPVLLVVEQANAQTRAVLLNRRTGYLLGDLGQSDSDGDGDDTTSSPLPILEKFCIQPLWFGGVDAVGSLDDTKSSSSSSSSSSTTASLDMLHQCPNVVGAVQITDDGLYWGGDPVQAQEAMSNTDASGSGGAGTSSARIYTGFDFKFFLQSTVYDATELQQELASQTFFPVRVSKEVLFQSRDRMGSRRAKPLWTEIMELLGGDYVQIKNTLYGNAQEGEESAYL